MNKSGKRGTKYRWVRGVRNSGIPLLKSHSERGAFTAKFKLRRAHYRPKNYLGRERGITEMKHEDRAPR